MMAENVQRHTALTDVAERTMGSLSSMKGLVDLFFDKALKVANYKALNALDIYAVTSYAREAYLTVSLLLICDRRFYGNLVEDMGNNYAMGQDNYPRTLPKTKKLLKNWQHRAWNTPRPPTGGLDFSQERTNDEGTSLTNDGGSSEQSGRPRI